MENVLYIRCSVTVSPGGRDGQTETQRWERQTETERQHTSPIILFAGLANDVSHLWHSQNFCKSVSFSAHDFSFNAF